MSAFRFVQRNFYLVILGVLIASMLAFFTISPRVGVVITYSSMAAIGLLLAIGDSRWDARAVGLGAALVFTAAAALELATP